MHFLPPLCFDTGHGEGIKWGNLLLQIACCFGIGENTSNLSVFKYEERREGHRKGFTFRFGLWMAENADYFNNKLNLNDRFLS